MYTVTNADVKFYKRPTSDIGNMSKNFQSEIPNHLQHYLFYVLTATQTRNYV
jgi:hypothetical protein